MRQAHLYLRKAGESDRPPNSGPRIKKADRDNDKFYHTQVKTLDAMRDSYERDQQDAPPYMKPNLVFKIDLTDNVHDDTFRKELQWAGIHTISSAPDKKGYWAALADDANFTKFRKKLKKYRSSEKPNFIDQIKAVQEIPPRLKMGKSLERPVPYDKWEYVDVEVWRMEDKRLKKFVAALHTMIDEQGGRITDEIITNSFYLARVHCSGQTIEALARLREVAHIGRPISTGSKPQRAHNRGEIEAVGAPEPGVPDILVVDSGVNDHPLLKDAIGGRKAHSSDDGGVVEGYDIDDAGHGTSVAGVALYGNVEKCLAEKLFDPKIWIYSAKVMYEKNGLPDFHEESLVEHQLKDAVDHASAAYRNCTIVNISLGNTEHVMEDGKRQFRIASLIDELSDEHKDLLFVIAAGNVDYVDTVKYTGTDHFASPPSQFRVIDPATSAHGITVGSIDFVHKNMPVRPSKFTRVGPGLRGMIKPELIEIGSNDNDGGVLLLNPWWHKDGNRFTRDWGTSISAPVVSHMMAMLARAFPGASRNLLKALVLSSASIPAQRPGSLGELDERGNSADIKKLHSVYGYGRPNLDHALHSDSDRVVLMYDGVIGVKRVDFFPLMLPDDFFKKKGMRAIEITLAYDPPTDAKRQEYMGVTMEYALYKNAPLDLIRDAYNDAASSTSPEERLGERLKNLKVDLLPGSRIRKRCTHQKSSVVYRAGPHIDVEQPLVLAVSCQNRWHRDTAYKQKYALVVTVKHGGGIDLYSGIKENVLERSEVERVTA